MSGVGAKPPLLQGDANFTSLLTISEQITEALSVPFIITQEVTGLLPPVNATDAVNKEYVDVYGADGSWKNPVRVATTSDETLDGIGQTIDGIIILSDDRILVKDQIDTSENGLYVATTGLWARSSDAATGSTATGMFVYVTSGTLNGTEVFVCETLNATFGQDITYTQFGGSSATEPGGSTIGSIQYNSGNIFTGDTNFYWTNSTLTVTGNITTSGITSNTNVTDSISPETGSVQLAGGIGILGDVHVAGSVYANTFLSTSDILRKTDIKPLHGALEIINKIESCSYKLDHEKKTQYGVIAQQLDEIGLDNLVNKTDQIKSVNYLQLIALLVSAVQELNNELDILKKLQNIDRN